MSKKEISVRFRLQSSYITTTISMALVLFVLGLLGLIILHGQILSEYVKENIGFTVMMHENTKEADIVRIQKILDARPYIKTTEYITPEQAAKRVEKDLGEDFVKWLGYIPIPPSVELRLNANWTNNDSLEVIEKEILAYTGVKEVFYQKSLVHVVNDNIKKISIIMFAFGLLLLIISIALINNTIRLSVYSKRFIIRSMQLVGATQGFIRKPFLWRGVIQGFIASLLAIAMLVGLLHLSQKELPELADLQNIDYLAMLFGIVFILGIIISYISNFFAVSKYLRIKTDYLYY
jgi:cell division transport system permease protein